MIICYIGTGLYIYYNFLNRTEGNSFTTLRSQNHIESRCARTRQVCTKIHILISPREIKVLRASKALRVLLVKRVQRALKVLLDHLALEVIMALSNHLDRRAIKALQVQRAQLGLKVAFQ